MLSDPPTPASEQETSPRRYLMWGSVGNLLVRGGGQVLSFAAVMIAVRVMSPVDFGIYWFLLGCTNISVLVGKAGLDNVLVKLVPEYLGVGGKRRVRGLLRFARATVFGWGLVVAGAMAAIIGLGGRPEIQGHGALLVLIGGLVLVRVVSAIEQSVLRARMRPNQAYIGEMFLRPLLLTMVFGGVLLGPGIFLTDQQGLTIQMIVGVVVLLINLVLARRACRDVRLETASGAYEPARWLRLMPVMGLLSASTTVIRNTDTVMLGAMTGPTAAGLYGPVSRLVDVVGFGLVVIGGVLAPMIARLHAQAQPEELARLVRLASLAMFGLALPPAVVMLVGPRWTLGLFGAEYEAGALALRILTVAQLSNALAGPAGFLLSMTGHAKLAGKIVAVVAAANILLNAALIPRFGVAGAAVATGVSVIGWNIVFVLVARRRLGVASTFMLRGNES